MNIVFHKRKIKILAMDCTEHCNARCLFCFNDWRKLKPALMDTGDFKKILPLLPEVEDDGFYLSCLFEPTLNPQFFDMLKMLPGETRNKVFFTTNLVRPLSDEELTVMCQANLDHINISLETFNPELYHKLSGTKQSAFYENLARLGKISQQYGAKIRLITLMMKDNYEELPEILEKAHNMLHPYQHEFRTPIYTAGDPVREKATEDQLLSREKLDVMRQKLEAYHYDMVFDTRWDHDYYMDWKAKELSGHNQDKNRLPSSVFRLYADGHGTVEDLNETYNWRDTTDLHDFVVRKFTEVKQKEDQIVQQNFLKKIKASHIKEAGSIAVNVDEAEMFDRSYMHVRGWAFDQNGKFRLKNGAVIAVENGSEVHTSTLETESRSDVSAAFSGKPEQECGFTANIPLSWIDSRYDTKIMIGWHTGFHYSGKILGVIKPTDWNK